MDWVQIFVTFSRWHNLSKPEFLTWDLGIMEPISWGCGNVMCSAWHTNPVSGNSAAVVTQGLCYLGEGRDAHPLSPQLPAPLPQTESVRIELKRQKEPAFTTSFLHLVNEKRARHSRKGSCL